jgi:anti-anti-sigma factor
VSTTFPPPSYTIMPSGRPGCFVLRLTDSPNEDAAAALRSELLRLCAREPQLLVLDVSGLREIDSATLALMLLCRRLVSGAAGKFRLAGASPSLQDVLRVTRLVHVLDCRPDVASALVDATG